MLVYLKKKSHNNDCKHKCVQRQAIHIKSIKQHDYNNAFVDGN